MTNSNLVSHFRRNIPMETAILFYGSYFGSRSFVSQNFIAIRKTVSLMWCGHSDITQDVQIHGPLIMLAKRNLLRIFSRVSVT